jgi:uncharacterized protein (UPF0305 family)
MSFIPDADCTREELMERLARLRDRRDVDMKQNRGIYDALTKQVLAAKKAKRLANRRADSYLEAMDNMVAAFTNAQRNVE